MPYAQRIQYASFADNQQAIEQRWHKKWGDRLNELVFIGQDMDKEQILADLDQCLLQDHEFDMTGKAATIPDPFPQYL